MTTDWYPAARRSIVDCLSSVLSIDERLAHPDRANDGRDWPDMPPDERARLAYFAEYDLLTFAQMIRKLAASADWEAVVTDAVVATNVARVASRAAYDERMAAMTETGGTA